MSTVNQDQMSPDTSPGKLAKFAGVRKVNNWPMIIAGSALVIFLGIMALVAADRAAKQNEKAQEKEKEVLSSSTFAKDIAGGPEAGIIPDATALPPVMPKLDNTLPAEKKPDAPAVAVVRPSEDLTAPPTPPGYAPATQVAVDPALEQIKQMKTQQLFDAVKAKTRVSVDQTASYSSGSSRSNSSAPTSNEDALARIAAARAELNNRKYQDPTQAYKQQLAAIRGESGGSSNRGMGGSSSDDSPFLVNASNSSRNSYDQFDNASGKDRWELKSTQEAPKTPYVIQAGFVIPGIMITGINSDLPGQVTAQVAQDVSDTPTGKWVLVPQGTRLVGTYGSDVAYGQNRVMVAWQRLVFPDGKTMDIGSMPGADSAGYSGFHDLTNNHLLRLFGSAFLMSGITAGISLSQDSSSGYGQETASSAMSEALGQQLGQVTSELIRKNLNVSPTLEIRPGYRFNVTVTKDMVFSKPYKAFDY
ncbi:type IV secretion system protein VirB10 [Pseudomonas duriflava]|uniref:Type IV secretion system protein VirB10 n=1 Tax=Pseudomonas duriflava TaxID=459528 RepID=A0A562PP08_9PSED|nr:TrbI/VirB10 family protein [Pseudomonas duriflava]TWI46167.1 type IV secretion system protein VirB10 [Pseudomonas duriflava]